MAISPPNQYLSRAVTAAIADALCFAAAAGITWHLLTPPFSPLAYGAATAIGALGCFAALYYADGYGLKALSSGRHTFRSVVVTMGMAFVLAIGIYHFAQLPRGAVNVMADTAALYFPLLLLERFGFRVISSLKPFTERLLIVGASDPGVATARFAIGCSRVGTELVGFLSDELAHERSYIGRGDRVIRKQRQGNSEGETG
jgi:hypothetical protein